MNNQPPEYRNIHQLLHFDEAKHNFFKAARHGLETQFRWMGGQLIPAQKLILEELLPLAEEGLRKAGTDSEDITHYLGIIGGRVSSGKTGADWLLQSFEKLRPTRANYEVCVALTAATVRRQQEGHPVHTWEPARAEEAGAWGNRYRKAGQIMDTDFLSVQEEDPVFYVANLMNWKRLRYLPVEDGHGQLVGLFTSRHLMEYFSQPKKQKEKSDATIRSLMIPDPVTVSPDVPSLEALQLMRRKKIGCLPVVENGKLVGLLTELSFMNLSEEAIRLLGEN